jgi:release factor glutamine methyltransferase
MPSAESIPAIPATDATVRSLVDWSTAYLEGQGFDEAKLHAELLLAHALHLPRPELVLHPNLPIDSATRGEFVRLLGRRLTHEPLQYIVGETEFMGLPLSVDRRVLIPRPETELLVEHAISIARRWNGALRILDVGTGSGNIEVALGKYLPGSSITGIDASGDAIAVAADNVRRHALRNVRLLQADFFDDLDLGGIFEMIVSNPPYVAAEEFPTLQAEVRDFEPRSATTDDSDGLHFLRRLAPWASDHLVVGGVLIVEIGFGQSAAATGIVRASGFAEVETIDDIAGIPRIVIGVHPGDGNPG